MVVSVEILCEFSLQKWEKLKQKRGAIKKLGWGT